jgi:hypothetical protein
MLRKGIKNYINRWVHHMNDLEFKPEFISKLVASMVRERGPIGTGKYACTCNNWGPRWLENSEDGCCPGCFRWALDHHQMMSVNGVKPVTMAMIEQSASWGFNILKIRELRLEAELTKD